MFCATDFLRRIAGTVLALIVAVLGCLTFVSAANAETPPSQVQAHGYDAPEYDQPTTYTETQRGPPVVHVSTAASAGQRAVDRRSHGTVARLLTPGTYGYTAYDVHAQLAQFDNDTDTTDRHFGTIAVGQSALHSNGVAAKGATGAESALSGALLKSHLRQLEKYGQGGFRELESGRFRYYGELSPASKSGAMVGRRLVREWNPGTGGTRTWHETIDRSGSVRIVRPETGGPKTHYYFDEFGNFGGSW